MLYVIPEACQAMQHWDITERAREIIDDRTRHIHRRWKHLETLTGVPASAWQNLALGRQQSTAAMVQALGRVYPQFAFWLCTGITDQAHGHTAPPNATTFPESRINARTKASEAFECALDMRSKWYGPGPLPLDSETQRSLFARWRQLKIERKNEESALESTEKTTD